MTQYLYALLYQVNTNMFHYQEQTKAALDYDQTIVALPYYTQKRSGRDVNLSCATVRRNRETVCEYVRLLVGNGMQLLRRMTYQTVTLYTTSHVMKTIVVGSGVSTRNGLGGSLHRLQTSKGSPTRAHRGLYATLALLGLQKGAHRLLTGDHRKRTTGLVLGHAISVNVTHLHRGSG